MAGNGWRRWPPRLDWQPIFYPVLNQEYATELACGFQVPAFGASHVTRFEVDSSYLAQFDVQRVGSNTSLEYWIPAEELDEFNDHIVGSIEGPSPATALRDSTRWAQAANSPATSWSRPT